MKYHQWFEQHADKVVKLHHKHWDASVFADVETLYKMFKERLKSEQSNDEQSK